MSVKAPKKQKTILGRYIVADPKICHGKPTFIGTRIMVWQILEQIGRGLTPDQICDRWGGSVAKEAIVEAVMLAKRSFEDHATEYGEEKRPA
jgi:uncharacterized protein (DUF433 family)